MYTSDGRTSFFDTTFRSAYSEIEKRKLVKMVVLLVRSLGNLIKNALEATDIDGSVNVFSEKDDTSIRFSVFNDKVIPDNIQLQIFQRSFSTKAKSAGGTGTYCVKLLVEQYLNGKVYFKSNNEIGTIFTLEIPLTN